MINLQGPSDLSSVTGQPTDTKPEALRRGAKTEKMEAAYASIVSGQGVSMYEKVRAEQESSGGKSPASSSVINQENKTLNETARQTDVVISYLTDESIPLDFRKGLLNAAHQDKLQQGYIEHTASKYLVDEADDEMDDGDTERRISLGSSIKRMADSQIELQREVDRAKMSVGEVDVSRQLTDLGYRFLPFNDTVAAANAAKKLQEEGKLPEGALSWQAMSGSQADLLLNVKQLRDATPISQRPQLIREVMPVLMANTGFNSSLHSDVSDVNVTVLAEIEQALVDGDWGSVDLWLGRLGWAADVIPVVGGVIETGVKALKGSSKLSKAVDNTVNAAEVDMALQRLPEAPRAEVEMADNLVVVGGKTPVSPAQTAANTNTSKSKGMYAAINSDKTEEAAEALSGVSRNEYLVSEKLPQIASESGIVFHKTDKVDEVVMRSKIEDYINNNVAPEGDYRLDLDLIRQTQYARMLDMTELGSGSKLSSVTSSVGAGKSSNSTLLRQMYNSYDNRPYNTINASRNSLLRDMHKFGVDMGDIRVVKWDSDGKGKMLSKEEVDSIVAQEKASKMEGAFDDKGKQYSSGYYSLVVDVDYSVNQAEARSFASSGKLNIGHKGKTLDFITGLYGVSHIAPKAAQLLFPARQFVDREIVKGMSVRANKQKAVYAELSKQADSFEASFNAMEKGLAKSFNDLVVEVDLANPPSLHNIVMRLNGDQHAVDAFNKYVAYAKYTQRIRNNEEIAQARIDGYRMASFKDAEGKKTYARVKRLDKEALKAATYDKSRSITVTSYDATGKSSKRQYNAQFLHDNISVKTDEDLVAYINNRENREVEDIAQSLVDIFTSDNLYEMKHTPGGESHYFILPNAYVRNIEATDQLIDVNAIKSGYSASQTFVMRVNKTTGKRDVSLHVDDIGEAKTIASQLTARNSDSMWKFVEYQAKNQQEATELAKTFYELRDSAEVVKGKKSLYVSKPKLSSPYDLLNNLTSSSYHLADGVSHQGYIESAKTRFIAMYGHMLQEGKGGVKVFPKDETEIANMANSYKAKQAFHYIRSQELGDVNNWEMAYKNKLQSASLLAGEAMEKHGLKKSMVSSAIESTLSSPIQRLKEIARVAYITLNPLAQATYGMVDFLTNLGVGRAAYMLNPTDGGLMQDAAAMFAMRKGDFEAASRINGRDIAYNKEMWEDWKESGLTAATELQHAIDAGMKAAPRANASPLDALKAGKPVKALTETVKAGLRGVEKIAIEAPDNLNRMSTWLLIRDYQMDKLKTKKLSLRQKDEVIDLVSEVTLDMTKAGQTDLPKTLFGSPIQFYSTILKSAMKLLPLNVGSMPYEMRLKLVTTNAILFGLPALYQTHYDQHIAPHFPQEFNESEGLYIQRGMLWQTITDATGFKFEEGKFDAMSTGAPEMVIDLISSGYVGYLEDNSPAGSKLSQGVDLVRDFSLLLGLTSGVKPSPEALANELASFLSGGYSNLLKAEVINNQIESGRLPPESISDVYATTWAGSMASEAGAKQAYSFEVGDAKKAIEADAKMFVDDVIRHSKLEGIHSEEIILVKKAALAELFKESPEPLKAEVLRQLKQRIKSRDLDANMHLEMSKLMGMMTKSDAERLIYNHPGMSPEQQDRLLRLTEKSE